MTIRYGAWRGGPDPLEPPFDIREALDEHRRRRPRRRVAAHALNRLLRRGTRERRPGRAAPAARERARELRRQAVSTARCSRSASCWTRRSSTSAAHCSPIADDSARMAEAELDALPDDTARAVRQLADYQWRSPEARQTYEQIQELLRSEVLDAQFAGMRDALQNASPRTSRASGR